MIVGNLAPVLVVSVAGVQGTGKSTLARALSRRLDAAVLSRRPLMEALATYDNNLTGFPGEVDLARIGTLAYSLVTALLREQLEVGRSVIIDCGVDDGLRAQWRDISESVGATFVIIDTICSDVELHRRRFEARGPTWRGELGQTWQMLDTSRLEFRPHPEALFVADSVRSVEDNVHSILVLIA